MPWELFTNIETIFLNKWEAIQGFQAGSNFHFEEVTLATVWRVDLSGTGMRKGDNLGVIVALQAIDGIDFGWMMTIAMEKNGRKYILEV